MDFGTVEAVCRGNRLKSPLGRAAEVDEDLTWDGIDFDVVPAELAESRRVFARALFVGESGDVLTTLRESVPSTFLGLWGEMGLSRGEAGDGVWGDVGW